MKIYAGMATFGKRAEAAKDAIRSFLISAKMAGIEVEYQIYNNDHQAVDLGDGGKFEHLKKIPKGSVYFTLDDDIIYPKDYVQKTLDALNVYKGMIVTYHGRTLSEKLAKTYYNDPRTVRVHCLHDQPKDTHVEVPGTCVTAFVKGDWCEGLKTELKNAGDIALAAHAKRAGVKIMALAHEGGWIKLNFKVKLKETIFATANRKEIADYYNRVMC